MEPIRVTDKAVDIVMQDGLKINRERRRAIKNFSPEELQRYIVNIYRNGFQDGCDAVLERINNEAEENPMAGSVFKQNEDDGEVDEIQIDWEDILNIIREVKGIGPKLLNDIDKKLKETY